MEFYEHGNPRLGVTTFIAPDSIIKESIEQYKSRFPGAEFIYKNGMNPEFSHGFNEVKDLISDLLTREGVQNCGLQTLSARAIVQAPDLYPSTMLSSLPAGLKQYTDRATTELKSAGIMLG